VGSIAIRRSYKWCDMRIDPETYQKLNTECCSRYYSNRRKPKSIGWVGVNRVAVLSESQNPNVHSRYGLNCYLLSLRWALVFWFGGCHTKCGLSPQLSRS